MFGSFGQTPQQAQQPLFGGFNATSSASTAPTQPTMFGSQPATQPGALNLFGSSTSTSQPLSQPGNLFGSGTATSQPSMPLFGQNVSSASAAPSLFGSTSTQPAQTGLFGSPAVSSQLGGTGNLLVSQPKTPLFGQTTTVTSGITPAPVNLFGGTTPSSQPSLFGPNMGTTSQASGGLFSGTASTQPQQTTMGSTFANMPSTGKNSPLEQEIPPQLVTLLQTLRTKIKENFEHTSKSNLPLDPTELSESMANAEYFMRTVKNNTSVVFSDAREFVGKVTGDVCGCKELIEVDKQKKLHPSQASEQLCQLLFKFGNNLHTKIDKLNDKVYELEHPLREYISWKENGTETLTIGKHELLEHVRRILDICNLTYMNTATLNNKAEQLKILYTAHLRQLHGNSVKSPFKSEESFTKSTDLFEYDPQRGMKVPNIFPSTTSLLSLVNMQKSVVGQQSTFGTSFGQPQPTSTSFFNAQRPSPFTLGSAPTSTVGTGSLGTSLFNKPLAATAPFTTTSATSPFSSTTTNAPKPAFQLPAVNVNTSSFGSTLNSSSSGTLFGGTALGKR